MNEYICDDRVDAVELANKINGMTDEEFEEYLKEMKSE